LTGGRAGGQAADKGSPKGLCVVHGALYAQMHVMSFAHSVLARPSSSRPQMATSHPAAASANAIDAPMPFDAPVTTARRPRSDDQVVCAEPMDASAILMICVQQTSKQLINDGSVESSDGPADASESSAAKTGGGAHCSQDSRCMHDRCKTARWRRRVCNTMQLNGACLLATWWWRSREHSHCIHWLPSML